MTSRKAFVPSFVLVLLTSVVALSLSACGGGSGSQPVRGPDIPYIPPGNRAPVIEQAFANITLTLAGSTAQWESGDISAYFSDPDNDRLEYQAEGSSNARVVDVTFSQTGPLIVRAVDAGTATITVTATDPRGLKVSQSFTVTVSGDGPDLVIHSTSVSDDTLTPGEQFTLSVTVRNQGDSRSAATTLRYKSHANLPIVTSDPTIGTDSVPSLDPSSTASESIRVTAPSTPGTYHYGACVDEVSSESDTGNNCSDEEGVRVTVSSEITSPTPPSGTPIRNVNVRIPSSCPTEVQVCVRDHQCEDGDIARVEVNGRLVFSGELFNQWSCHNAPVQAGRNVVEFLAVNGTGFKGQCDHSNVNTGQLRIIGGNTGETQTWSHAGGSGSTANLNVVVGPPGGACTPRGSPTPTPPPPPSQTNYGAIYFSFNGQGAYAWALRYGRTKSEAENNARNACRSIGGINCQLRISTNQCGALVVGSENGRVNYVHAGSGSTISEAERDAIIRCRNGGGQNCRIPTSDRDGSAASFCAN